MALRSRALVPPPALIAQPVSRVQPPTKTIPFDHSFRFTLSGAPGVTRHSVVEVSVEAAFTAVSIGYGVVPEVTPIVFGVNPPPIFNVRLGPTLREIRFGEVIDAIERNLSAAAVSGDTTPLEAALRNGVRLNPDFAALALKGNASAPIDNASLARLFQVASEPPQEAPFLYALFDEGSGREFQSGPILSIAGLGSAEGKRPFRYFATPITFNPLSRIRMEITELSAVRGELHVVLHGYKVLGDPVVAAAQRERRRRR